MRPSRRNTARRLISQFYISRFHIDAGNDSPQLKKKMSKILGQLEKLLV